MEKARLAELDAQLRRVFGDIPRPLATRSVAESWDDDWSVTEESAQALTAMDHEQHWWEVTDEELQRSYSMLRWVPPDSFRFYYTAFLSYTLRWWGAGGDLVVKAAMEDIGILSWDHRGRRQRGNLRCFTDAELEFIAETLMELWCDAKGGKFSGCALTFTVLEHEQHARAPAE